MGVYEKETFNSIQCSMKISVDALRPADYQMTTDKFFEINTAKYDIIFIDANHTEPFLTRDIHNSLKILNPGGCIICHDVNPPTEKSQIDENCQYQTAWKAFVRYRTISPYDTYTYPDDCGLGVIDTSRPRNNQEDMISLPEPLTYPFLDQFRAKLLNFK